MTPTKENEKGVRAITDLARLQNQEIGFYQQHYINENFGYTVRLTNNGGIRVSQEIAQDYEVDPASITEEQIQRVANSYWQF